MQYMFYKNVSPFADLSSLFYITYGERDRRIFYMSE